MMYHPGTLLPRRKREPRGGYSASTVQAPQQATLFVARQGALRKPHRIGRCRWREKAAFLDNILASYFLNI
jgi:hypothetical protein